MADESRPAGIHPLAPEHLPHFLPTADGSDGMMFNMGVLLILSVLGLGVAYFSLHALPEKMAHKANSTQFQLIGVLALLALFTHNNVFWVAALVLAAVRLPDIMTPLTSIARSLEVQTGRAGQEAAPEESSSGAHGSS